MKKLFIVIIVFICFHASTQADDKTPSKTNDVCQQNTVSEPLTLCEYPHSNFCGKPKCQEIQEGEVVNFITGLNKVGSFNINTNGYFTIYSDVNGDGKSCITVENKMKQKCSEKDWRWRANSIVFRSTPKVSHKNQTYPGQINFGKFHTRDNPSFSYLESKITGECLILNYPTTGSETDLGSNAGLIYLGACDKGESKWGMYEDSRVINYQTSQLENTLLCLNFLVGDALRALWCDDKESSKNQLFYWDGLYLRKFDNRELVLDVRADNAGEVFLKPFDGSTSQQWYWGK